MENMVDYFNAELVIKTQSRKIENVLKAKQRK